MENKPLILITNDDGIHAPGIRHLWNALHQMADLFVVAPAKEQSAVGLSVTIRDPIQVHKVSWNGAAAKTWSVTGTPADCVKLALNTILPSRPTLVVSGLNRGSNAGRNLLYSGTVAAVIEGTIKEIPGIAFSMTDFMTPSYADAEPHVSAIVSYVLKHPLPKGTLLNVNFPTNLKEGFKGIRLASQGKEYWQENLEKREHPVEGNDYYWLGARVAEFEERDHSDITYLKMGYATAVPVFVEDLTHHDYHSSSRNHFELHVNQK